LHCVHAVRPSWFEFRMLSASWQPHQTATARPVGDGKLDAFAFDLETLKRGNDFCSTIAQVSDQARSGESASSAG
jgi:hypothetical protein